MPKQLIRYTGLAVGLKPSAMGCEGRLRGLYPFQFLKLITRTARDEDIRFPRTPVAHGFRGGQNVWAQTGVMALGCAGWPSPPSPLPHAGEG